MLRLKGGMQRAGEGGVGEGEPGEGDMDVLGRRGADADAVLEAEAMAIVAFLYRYHEPALASIVADIGHYESDEGQPGGEAELRALSRHLGPAGLDEIANALRKGRHYRP